MLPTHRPPTHAGEMLLKEFLEPVLFKAMGYKLDLPKVKSRYLGQVIEICPQLKDFVVDATERKIRRPKDGEKQQHPNSLLGSQWNHLLRTLVHFIPE